MTVNAASAHPGRAWFVVLPVALVLALGPVLALLLGSTAAEQAPLVPGAPKTTTSTLRIAAVDGDEDALLAARATAMALRGSGFSAELISPGHGLSGSGSSTYSAGRARQDLAQGEVDLVLAGASSVQPPDGHRVKDAVRARERIAADLPDDVAVASAWLEDRRDVLVTTAALAASSDLESVADTKKICSGSRVLVPREMGREAWQALSPATGCTEARTTDTRNLSGVGQGLLQGKAELGVATSTETWIQDLGMVTLSDQDGLLPADPVLGLVGTAHLGQDALEVVRDPFGDADTEDWQRLRRLVDDETGAAGGVDADLGRWMVAHSAVDDAGDGLPAADVTLDAPDP